MALGWVKGNRMHSGIEPERPFRATSPRVVMPYLIGAIGDGKPET